jgi:hypothetical protein
MRIARLDRAQRGMPAAARAAMRPETTAWLIVSVAGISSGVIAGIQNQVTATAVIAIAAVVAIAAGVVSRVLPRHADSMT